LDICYVYVAKLLNTLVNVFDILFEEVMGKEEFLRKMEKAYEDELQYGKYRGEPDDVFIDKDEDVWFSVSFIEDAERQYYMRIYTNYPKAFDLFYHLTGNREFLQGKAEGWEPRPDEDIQVYHDIPIVNRRADVGPDLARLKQFASVEDDLNRFKQFVNELYDTYVSGAHLF